MYPAKQHATKAFKLLQQAVKGKNAIIYLEGEITRSRHDTDREVFFRQESNFFYMSGCQLPSARLVVSQSTDGKACHSALFVPDLNPDEVMWMGLPPTLEDVQRSHSVDSVQTDNKLSGHLRDLLANANSTIFTLPGTKSPIEGVELNATDTLRDAIAEARLIKSQEEIQLMREANEISSHAHEQVMRAVGRNEVKSEFQAQALFEFECKFKASKCLAYEVIAAYGKSSSTLHYIVNDKNFEPDAENLILIDAGCEVNNYAADITRTFPVGNGGKFTKEGRQIYDIVLEMQDTALAEMKPGESWERIHLLMHKVLIRGLLKIGILISGPSNAQGEELVEELYEKNISAPFFPHGLGHCLGLDVHDTPGKTSRPDGASTDPRAKYLRYRGQLKEGMVITAEPGLYFNPFLLEPVKDSPHVNYKMIAERYIDVGGVRIEDEYGFSACCLAAESDSILITKDGIENLTTAVRTVAEIEKLTSHKQA